MTMVDGLHHRRTHIQPTKKTRPAIAYLCMHTHKRSHAINRCCPSKVAVIRRAVYRSSAHICVALVVCGTSHSGLFVLVLARVCVLAVCTSVWQNRVANLIDGCTQINYTFSQRERCAQNNPGSCRWTSMSEDSRETK